MRKGITPIISIIMLLLITIGLSAAAWSYMSNYLSEMTTGVVQVSDTTCIGGTSVIFFVKNVGTNALSTSQIIGLDKSDGSSLSFTWEYQNGSTLSSGRLASGQVGKATVSPDCTTLGQSKTCSYKITVEGTTYSTDVVAPCSG